MRRRTKLDALIRSYSYPGPAPNNSSPSFNGFLIVFMFFIFFVSLYYSMSKTRCGSNRPLRIHPSLQIKIEEGLIVCQQPSS